MLTRNLTSLYSRPAETFEGYPNGHIARDPAIALDLPVVAADLAAGAG